MNNVLRLQRVIQTRTSRHTLHNSKLKHVTPFSPDRTFTGVYSYSKLIRLSLSYDYPNFVEYSLDFYLRLRRRHGIFMYKVHNILYT